MELDPRKREILRIVIDSYIATGEPVGSKSVAPRMKKPCSSATIRNEMSDLEEMGLLEHPHTSAGRVPTLSGYRMYVDSLMEHYTLSFEETLLLNSLLSDKAREAGEILEDMNRLLAKMTGCAIASFTRQSCGTIERFDGVYINERAFLLVLVTSAGRAITRHFPVSFPLTPERLRFLIRVLDGHLAKKELGGVTMERMLALEKDLGEFRGVIPPLIQIIYDVMAEMGEVAVSVYGLANLLSFPEFQGEEAAKIVGQLEDTDALLERFGREIPSHLQVHIGQGGGGLDGAGSVICPFRLKNGLQGAVCVIGPKRMNYAEIVSRLQYLAKEIHAVHGFEPSLPLIEKKDQ